jgi:hypothetical protein
MLTSLSAGQVATVLQLPAQPKTPEEAQAQTWAAYAARVRAGCVRSMMVQSKAVIFVLPCTFLLSMCGRVKRES